MTRNRSISKTLAAVSVGTVLALLSTLPVAATPKDADGEHKVTICHVTNSATNPWVEITVDVAAFDGLGKNDHSHHVSKDERMDFEVIEGLTCPPGGDDPPPA